MEYELMKLFLAGPPILMTILFVFIMITFVIRCARIENSYKKKEGEQK